MPVDRVARARREVQAQAPKRCIGGVVVRGREFRAVIDARRELLTRAAQALLLSVVPPRPVRAPLPASSFVTPRSDQVFRRSSGSGRVSPCPSPAALPRWFGADAGP